MRAVLNRLLIVLVIALLSETSRAGDVDDVLVELGDLGHDMVLDLPRSRLYVSVPVRNEIAVISTDTYTIVDWIAIGMRPHGIDLSADGTRLFAALRGTGSVAIYTIDTGEIVTVDIETLLDHENTYDLIEGRPERLFVSANPGSGGFAYIVMIRLDDQNSARRVASNRIIRANPIFEDTPDRESLFIGEGFSPNSIYKLDITVDDAPIILEDDHGSVSGSSHLEVNPVGDLIYTRSGQVFGTDDLIQDGVIGGGVSQFSIDGDTSRIYVAQEPSTIRVYETNTYTELDQIDLSCSFQTINRLIVLSENRGVLVLGDDLVCGSAVPGPPPPIVTSVVPGRMAWDASSSSVTISGQFFGLGETTQVHFADREGLNVQVVDDGTITCDTPTALPGIVDVTVTNEHGVDVLEEAFVFAPALSVSGELEVGGRARIKHYVAPGDGIFVFWGAANIIPPPWGGELLISPARLLFSIPSWPFDEFVMLLDIPDDPRVGGAEFLLQSLVGAGFPAGVAWTNAALVQIDPVMEL